MANNGSVDKSLDIRANLLKKYPNAKIIVVCSKTQGDDDVKALLKDTSLISKYDGVIASPSIQSGLDIVAVNTIANVYGCFGNNTNSSGDCAQMIKRVRNPICKRICISVKQSSCQGLTTAYDVREHILSNGPEEDISIVNNACRGSYSNFTGKWSINQNEFFKMYCDNKAASNLDRANFIHNLVSKLKGYGSDVSFMADDDVKDDLDDKLKTAACERSAEDHKTLAATIDIDTDEFERITKLNPSERSNDEYNQYRRWLVKNTYGLDGNHEDLTQSWFSVYGDRATQNEFKNNALYFGAKADDVGNMTIPMTLQESLDTLNEKEQASLMYMHKTSTGDTISKDAYTAKIILKRFKGKKHSILINMIQTFGFDTLNPRMTKPVADIDKALDKIHTDHLSDDGLIHTGKVLGKQMERLKTIEKGNRRKVLDFVNNALKAEFGCSVGRISKNNPTYTLHDRNFTLGIFKDPSDADAADMPPNVLDSKTIPMFRDVQVKPHVEHTMFNNGASAAELAQQLEELC